MQLDVVARSVVEMRRCRELAPRQIPLLETVVETRVVAEFTTPTLYLSFPQFAYGVVPHKQIEGMKGSSMALSRFV